MKLKTNKKAKIITLKKEEKGVDLKIKISNDLLLWFLNESESFYLIIDDQGKILLFSENSLIFFSIKNDYKIGENFLSKLIGDKNWLFLSSKFFNNPNNIENSLILPELINTSYTFGIKWKSYKDEEQNRIFLIFKQINIKNNEDDNLEYFESDDDISIENYKKCIDLLDIPVAILIDNDFHCKNLHFQKIIENKNINNYDSLINWIKQYSTDNNFNIDDLKNNFEKEIILDQIHYNLKIKHFSSDSKFSIISLLKIESTKPVEIIEKEKINSINETQIELKIKFDDFVKQLNDIKIEVQNEYNNINNFFNFDLKTLHNTINQNYSEYEKIITYTSENLLNMTKNFNFIEDISVTIHLISINAAIESAKSGEQGKGFAVIAREIAKLSTEIKEYIKKIGRQIKTINEYTQKITIKEKIQMTDSTEKFDNIINIVESVKTKITDMTYSITEKINNLINKE